jgi:ATP-dependent RNA helicase DDX19/DBP5
MEGRNIIGQAQNGFGKTAAFAIAMLLGVDATWAAPQALCICPTRELASQNHDVIAKIGRFTGMELFLAVPQAERMPRSVYAQIVVGTPGKLQDLIKKRTIDPKGFKIFVLDEADVMIDENQQMGPQVFQIRQLLPDRMQVLLFSATFPENVENFARKMVPKANTIKVQKEDLTLSTITQTFIDVGGDARQKPEKLSSLYGVLNIGQSIVFVNTRTMAFELAKMMKNEGHAVSLICGTQPTGPERIDVAYRDRVMGEFRSGVTKVLIATDVLARGIDVPAVTLVVNYELPLDFGRRGHPNYETYIHRIGRTGRFGLRGVAVNLVCRDERPLMDNIKHFFSCDIAELSGDLDEMQNMVRNLR